MCLLLLTLLTSGAPQGHESANALFRELRRTGVPIGQGTHVPLPAPSMADGLDSTAQLAVLRSIAGDDYSLDELLRNSIVAPQVLRLRTIAPSDPQAPARGVDVWFIAHGDLDALAGHDLLDRLFRANRKEGQIKAVPAPELARRGIVLRPGREKYERFGHTVFSLLNRVQIQATGQAVWSRTPESVLAAIRLDPRFAGDPDYPNQWRAIKRTSAGEVRLGPPHTYDGAGYYVKITRLAGPGQALFVEAHLVFVEPEGWFGGANLLRSKLPALVQSQVRSLRRELVKASRKKDEG